MAQTKTKTKSGGSARSAGTGRRSNGSQTASKARRANGSSRTRGTASKTRAPKRNAANASSKAQNVTQESQEQPSTLSEIASKAKTPLVAGGAAVAGVVGGMALARNGRSKGLSIPTIGGSRRKSRSSISLRKLSMPKLGKGDSTGKALGATAKALGNTAKEIGKAGYRVGELTSEVRRVREQARDD
jgi:hypothetical protein